MQYVDLDVILPQKDSFIDEKLQESFSDLLFQTKILNEEGYLYFLFEHKSSPDPKIPLQLLKYIVNIWEARAKKVEKDKWVLPIIIPLVIYHGPQKWHAPRRLSDMMTGYTNFPYDLIGYIPDFTYQFFDFSFRSTLEIKGDAILRIYHTMVNELFDPNNDDKFGSLLKAMSYVEEIKNKQRATEYLETMLRYLFDTGKDLTEAEMIKVVETISENHPEGSKIAMTLAEYYREKGIKIGEVKGIKIGEAKGIIQTTLQLLTKKFGELPEDFISEIKQMDIPALEAIVDNIFEYETLEDVRKFIP